MDPTLRPISASIRTTAAPRRRSADEPAHRLPFVTISRQAGAGALELASSLVAVLNERSRAAPAWRCFDRELVERIAADHDVPVHHLQNIEERAHSWVDDLVSGLRFSNSRRDDQILYQKACRTIRDLAGEGHCVIVGAGAVFATEDMPLGLHLRLVAPREHRIEGVAHQRNLSRDDAAQWMMRVDANREDFFRRCWPGRTLAPEAFAMTINTAAVAMPVIVEMVMMLIDARETSAATTHWGRGPIIHHGERSAQA